MAISRAIRTGLRNGVMNTLGPNLSRLVRPATAAIAVIGSGTVSGEESRSENQSESISLFSQSSTKRQKKSRPAGPAGQGPGMTPTRYLMRMAATLPRHRLLGGAPAGPGGAGLLGGGRLRVVEERGDHGGGQDDGDDGERPYDRELPTVGPVE